MYTCAKNRSLYVPFVLSSLVLSCTAFACCLVFVCSALSPFSFSFSALVLVFESWASSSSASTHSSSVFCSSSPFSCASVQHVTGSSSAHSALAVQWARDSGDRGYYWYNSYKWIRKRLSKLLRSLHFVRNHLHLLPVPIGTTLII